MTSGSIEAYRFGALRLSGETHTRDLIILPDGIISGWRREEGHTLRLEGLGPVLESAPEVLVIGSGCFGRISLPDRTRSQLGEAGIDVVLERTRAACRAYNRLRGSRRVAAALHLA